VKSAKDEQKWSLVRSSPATNQKSTSTPKVLDLDFNQIKQVMRHKLLN